MIAAQAKLHHSQRNLRWRRVQARTQPAVWRRDGMIGLLIFSAVILAVAFT